MRSSVRSRLAPPEAIAIVSKQVFRPGLGPGWTLTLLIEGFARLPLKLGGQTREDIKAQSACVGVSSAVRTAGGQTVPTHEFC